MNYEGLGNRNNMQFATDGYC